MHGIKICGDIYQRVRYGLWIIISHVASLNPATGPIYDVIKMATVFNLEFSFFRLNNKYLYYFCDNILIYACLQIFIDQFMSAE